MNPVNKLPSVTPKVRKQKRMLPDLEKDMKSVKVFCRLKPLKNDQESTCIKLLSPTVLALTTPEKSKGIYKEVHCKFEHIFSSSATQMEVFEHITYSLLEDLLGGKNGLLFTYGVTDSGKTYTLSGNQSNPGIMPKSIHTIFNTISDHQTPKSVMKSNKMNGFDVSFGDVQLKKTVSKTPFKTKNINRYKTYINDCRSVTSFDEKNFYVVFISYVEIYNNIVFDLLDDSNGNNLQSKIVREDAQKNMYVSGVVELEVKSAEEAFELFNIGQKKKRMGNTVLNSVSSRSHSIFTIRVVQFQPTVNNADGRLKSSDINFFKAAQLSFVDLAGIERAHRTQTTGQLLKEASQINKSLSTLRNCIDILRRNQLFGTDELVPYRDSRLTLLFKSYFEGHGNVSMIVCVKPSVEDYEENLQVMNFAEATKDVKVTRPKVRCTPYKINVQKEANTLSANIHFSSITLPLIPETDMNFTTYEESEKGFNEILDVLKQRAEMRRDLETEFDQKVSHFRKRLFEIEQEIIRFKAEVKRAKNVSRREKQKTTIAKKTFSNTKSPFNQQTPTELKRQIENVRAQIDAKEKELQKMNNLLSSNIEARAFLHEYNASAKPGCSRSANLV